MVEGDSLAIAIDDPGLLYGATVFTTLRVYEQSLDSGLTNWQGHCDRLYNSVTAFGWLQPDWVRLRQGAELLMQHSPVLRITLFPDGREWIIGRALPADLANKQKNGVIASVISGSQLSRSLVSHKTGNYLSAWLAQKLAQQQLAQEAILVDASSGNWLETSTGNLWGWRDGYWWTPPIAAGILAGTVRSQLINWLQVKEENWHNELLRGFEAIAYTNSVVEVIPFHTINEQQTQRHYNPHHPALRQLKDLFSPPKQ
nr:aminotransferase class IV [Aliterella atlantica]